MRLFIAVPFDENILSTLTKFQDELKALGMLGRFPPRENLHLTLAFIGEFVDPDAVMDALASVRFTPFRIRLDGMGNFRDLYWVGLAKNAKLKNYVKRLRRALAERNIPYDRKRFSPHITLVRSAVFRGDFEFPQVDPPAGEMQVRRVSLMRSERGKHGMIYTEIGTAGE